MKFWEDRGAKENLLSKRKQSDWTRERELLFRACRPSGPGDIQALLDQPLDWALLVSEAVKNGVTPLLYSALKDQAKVPESVRAELLNAWVSNVAQGLRLSSALIDILEELRANNVPALAYKGAALAVLAYGDVRKRCFGDLDILVRRSDLVVVKAVLEAKGYPCMLSAAEEAECLRKRYHLHFAGGDPVVSIEIHWGITYAYWPFPLDGDRLWGDASSAELMGVQIPTLDPELTLLAVCAHGAKECWPRLSQICDLAGILTRHPDLDWPWITAEVEALGRTRVLLLGLLLAASLLEAPVPEDLLSKARADHVVVAVAGQVRDHIFGGVRPAGLHFHRYAWRIWNRWPDRMRYSRHVIVSMPGKLKDLVRPSESDGSLPAGLSWFWRPLRVIWRFKGDPRRIFRHIVDHL